VWDKVLIVPLAGMVDDQREAELMDKLLSTTSSKRARFVIVDITGVQTVDTHAAGTLVRLAHGVAMLGASYILTGIRPEVARSLSCLGIDLYNVKTLPTVEYGLRQCLRQMGGARVAGMLWASIFRM
jgi:rsbT co-antagonist protein RsbR